MNDNYLWDKSGEPDEEIQQLESLLSEFRYQPRPLVLPVEEPKRGLFASLLPFFTMRYAMATAMALLVLSAGLWFVTRTTVNEQIAVQPTATPAPPREEKANVPAAQAVQLAQQTATVKPAPRFAKHHTRAVNKRLEAEGELAKEKVLLALQLTSRQLDLISKKMHADTN